MAKTEAERRELHRIAARKWLSANREKNRAAVAKCSQAPHAKEARRARSRAYAEANRKQERARSAAWRAENPDKAALSHAKYYAANKEKVRSSNAAYREAHKEMYLEYGRESKARRRCSGGERMPNGYRKVLWSAQEGRCAACQCNLSATGSHLDHIIAVAKGGEHRMENVQLLCPSCNRQKHTKDFSAFLAMKGFAYA